MHFVCICILRKAPGCPWVGTGAGCPEMNELLHCINKIRRQATMTINHDTIYHTLIVSYCIYGHLSG